MSSPTAKGEALPIPAPWPFHETLAFYLDDQDGTSEVTSSTMTLSVDSVDLLRRVDAGNTLMPFRPGSVEECYIFSRWFAAASAHFLRIADEWDEFQHRGSTSIPGIDFPAE